MNRETKGAADTDFEARYQQWMETHATLPSVITAGEIRLLCNRWFLQGALFGISHMAEAAREVISKI